MTARCSVCVCWLGLQIKSEVKGYTHTVCSCWNALAVFICVYVNRGKPIDTSHHHPWQPNLNPKRDPNRSCFPATGAGRASEHNIFMTIQCHSDTQLDTTSMRDARGHTREILLQLQLLLTGAAQPGGIIMHPGMLCLDGRMLKSWFMPPNGFLPGIMFHLPGGIPPMTLSRWRRFELEWCVLVFFFSSSLARHGAIVKKVRASGAVWQANESLQLNKFIN